MVLASPTRCSIYTLLRKYWPMQSLFRQVRPATIDCRAYLLSVRKVLSALFMGLFASLAFMVSAEAGSTTVTTTAFLFDAATVTDLFVEYDLGGGSITNLTLLGAIPTMPQSPLIRSTTPRTCITIRRWTHLSERSAQFSFVMLPPISSSSVDVKILEIFHVARRSGFR